MKPGIQEGQDEYVLGQKLAFATASLLLGIASFVSLLGMEKGILAIAFACLALKNDSKPRLAQRRGWAKAGLVLGILIVLIVPTMLLIFRDRVAALVEALEKL